MLIEKKNIPFPKENNCEENERFLKWCFNNGIEGRDIWSNFSYKSNNNDKNLNLIGANLEGLNLQGIYLAGAKLGSANLEKTNFTSANLLGANLIGANLIGASFANANLSEVDFFKTNLTNTNFTNAYLKNAYFKDAKISDTIFEKADLEGTNIESQITKQNISNQTKTTQEEESIEKYKNNTDTLKVYNFDKKIKEPEVIKPKNDEFINEIHGFIQLKGNIFTKDMDLRDISFYSIKILNIIDNSFQVNSIDNKALKNRFKVTLGKLSEQTLNLNLILNFGMRLTPLLLNRQTQIWNTASDVIKYIKDLGVCFNDEDLNSIQINIIQNSHLEISANNKIINIPTQIYKIMSNICEDLYELNDKIVTNDVSSIILNEKILLEFDSVKKINNGLHIFNSIKEYQINNIYQAQIEIYEINTLNNSGKAIMSKTNFHDALIPETIPFVIENELLSTLFNSMQKNQIVVNFKPVIEILANKKMLKSIILTR